MSNPRRFKARIGAKPWHVSGLKMPKVARHVQMQPMLPHRARLPGIAVGNGDKGEATGLEQSGHALHRPTWVGHVFEHVPKGHHVE
jgi:hypothetical protein